MKLFISADIEGTTGITLWEETEYGHPRYGYFARQMSREVAAACEGALAAGVEEILVKDAHGSACNIQPDLLPEEACIFRGWGSDIMSMMAGLEEGTDGVFFVGYHAGAGMDTNPLSHSFNTHNNYIKINGLLAPEMLVNGYTAAYLGVPLRLVTGDQGLCDYVKALNPNIETVPVSRGVGRGTISIHPEKALRLIREAAERAMKKDPADCMLPLPESFHVEISFKEHFKAKAASYPGVRQTGPTTVEFHTEHYRDVLAMLDNTL